MNVFQLWKLLQNCCQLLRKICLCELDFPHVEAADPGYLVVLVDHCGGLPLGLGQHDVSEVLAGGHHAYLLEVVVSHLGGFDYHFCKDTGIIHTKIDLKID